MPLPLQTDKPEGRPFVDEIRKAVAEVILQGVKLFGIFQETVNSQMVPAESERRDDAIHIDGNLIQREVSDTSFVHVVQGRLRMVFPPGDIQSNPFVCVAKRYP